MTFCASSSAAFGLNGGFTRCWLTIDLGSPDRSRCISIGPEDLGLGFRPPISIHPQL